MVKFESGETQMTALPNKQRSAQDLWTYLLFSFYFWFALKTLNLSKLSQKWKKKTETYDSVLRETRVSKNEDWENE